MTTRMMMMIKRASVRPTIPMKWIVKAETWLAQRQAIWMNNAGDAGGWLINGNGLQSLSRGAGKHFAMDVITPAMAWAIPAFLGIVPRNDTTCMGTYRA